MLYKGVVGLSPLLPASSLAASITLCLRVLSSAKQKQVDISGQCYLDNDLDIPADLESQFFRIKKSSTKNSSNQ
jgi:hypothetical protein